MEPTGAPEPKKLHPLTMVHRLIVAVPGFAVIMWPALRSGDTESLISLYIVIALGLLGLPLVIVQYQRFRYWITPNELIIHSGVIKRQHRNIPIERIQNVEIVRRLLSRAFGTAKVNVVTAGSTSTEGVLEYVSLKEAHRIREAIRSMKARQRAGTVPERVDDEGLAEPPLGTDDQAHIVEEETLYAMPVSRVVLSGVFRFSLFYIAIIFSTLQIFEPDPLKMIEYIEEDAVTPVLDQILSSPVMAAISLALVAGFISWISGILVNTNRLFGFKLKKDDGRIYKKSGLLTVSEGTIPIAKVQALIRRTNPAMRRFDWWSLSVQTMGHDVSEQRHKQAVPFGHLEDTARIAKAISPITFPSTYQSVSRLTIRRMMIRLTVILCILVLPTAYFWKPALWFFLLLPVIVVYSILRYRNHGYNFDGKYFSIRRGVIKQVEWSTSIDKFHVFYLQQTIFQKRYNLKSLYIDTAGASPVSSPTIVDIPAVDAEQLLDQLYTGFQHHYTSSAHDSPFSG